MSSVLSVYYLSKHFSPAPSHNLSWSMSSTHESLFLAHYDWTSGVPDNGKEWRKFRAAPRLHPLRSLVCALFSIGGNRRAFRLPGEGWDNFGGAFARSYSVLTCLAQLESAGMATQKKQTLWPDHGTMCQWILHDPFGAQDSRAKKHEETQIRNNTSLTSTKRKFEARSPCGHLGVIQKMPRVKTSVRSSCRHASKAFCRRRTYSEGVGIDSIGGSENRLRFHNGHMSGPLD